MQRVWKFRSLPGAILSVYRLQRDPEISKSGGILMSEIKPCPFCGNSASYWEDNRYDDRHVIECSNCGTSRRSEYGYNDVLSDWNLRYDAKGNEIPEIPEMVCNRYLPRLVAQTPDGGQVVIWSGKISFEEADAANQVGIEVAKDVQVKVQVIQVSEVIL